ncbi:hypothetical protein S101258_00474 [Lactiplantibacillus plantarum subsp. plantarum]|uniref:Uncharacterized protein n=1 Tax=Lactiplantibacillus plantarum subsp. plantarum TaxID=337330 RepID=A0A2S3U9U5_LACPN|nr:hypothetical protein S101258_00474 [Lactiplantibacillus plantarum subsp. plantarum]
MDSLLITNYKPDYNNNIMTISFTIKILRLAQKAQLQWTTSTRQLQTALKLSRRWF